MGELPEGTTPPRGLPAPEEIHWPLIASRDLFELRYGRSLVESMRRPGRVPVFGTNGRCGSHDQPLFKGPGVILGRKGQGPLGIEWSDDDYWVIDTAYSLAPLRLDIDLKYAYFLIKYVGLNHLKDGTSNPTLSRDSFGAQALPLPPQDQQRAIAHILGTLDDKIELNRRMSETLEAMARALFKSWFVDFDPVRAKAEGRDPGLPQPLADLFPARLVNSELGEIPEGWNVSTVESLSLRVGMGPFGSNIKVSTFVDHGVPVISGQHLHGAMLEDSSFNFITAEHAERLRSSIVIRGDIVFTHAGNIGQVSYISDRSRYEQYILSQRQFFLRCDSTKVSPLLMTYFFRSPLGQHKLLANASQVGVPSIARPVSYLKSIELVTPAKALSDRFDALVRGLHCRISNAWEEIEMLTKIRGYLLPKLISGELRVQDAEKFIEGLSDG